MTVGPADRNPPADGSLSREPVDLSGVLSQPGGGTENQVVQERRRALTRQRRAAVAAYAVLGIDCGLVAVQDLADHVGRVLVVVE